MKDKFTKVIIWGHKLHSHTHSYIHFGFYKTFKHLGYNTYWFDNNDDVSDFDFSNCLFITESQVDEKIPINKESFYVLHNCDGSKYKNIPLKQKIVIQVYTYDTDRKWKANPIDGKKYTFHQADCLWQPWATDLLPEEINDNIKKLESIKTKKISNFVGMCIPPWDEFSKACEKNGIQFKSYGGFNKDTSVSSEKNVELIQESIIAPALQHHWQVEHGYIPCRIFKNISYGKMGITNSEAVSHLFDTEIIYDTNIENLVKKALEFEERPDKNEIIKKLMIEVRDKHTYINRIETLLWFFEKHYNET